MTPWHFTDLTADDELLMHKTAQLLTRAFGDLYPEWSRIEVTEKYIRYALSQTDPGRINIAAVDDAGYVIGFIGGIPEDGDTVYLWELDPLAIDPSCQRHGIGQALINELENRLRARGAIALWVGTDDMDASTSLGGIDLYPDVVGRVAKISSPRGHTYQFYQKAGFTIIGAIPDANGFGKPTILLSKRL